MVVIKTFKLLFASDVSPVKSLFKHKINSNDQDILFLMWHVWNIEATKV